MKCSHSFVRKDALSLLMVCAPVSLIEGLGFSYMSVLLSNRKDIYRSNYTTCTRNRFEQ